MSFAALVLAGTRPGGDPLAMAEGVAGKALLEVDGVSMLARVVAALRAAGAGRIAVSCDEGPVAELARSLDAEVFPTAAGPSGSALLAFDQLGAPLLLTTADHALLEADWVKHLISATPSDCDLSLMLAHRADVERALPGSRRTWLRFADGGWSGCNLFFLASPAARTAIEAWQGIESDRKRPWRIAARLGPRTLFAFALGRLTLAQAIGRLGARMGMVAMPVRAPDGLAAVDADSPQDLTQIRALVAARK